MNSRFGLKDFVFLVLLLAVGASVWISMVQRDRDWTRLRDLSSSLVEIERQLARIERRIDRGGGVPAAGTAAGSRDGGPARDDAWARPGVEIAWQRPWSFASDPAADPHFQVGGEFTEIFTGRPISVTPFLFADVYGRWVVDRVCDTLGTYDPETMEPRGVLAIAWQFDPEARWLRVRLNPAARFSDGVPVTAEDVRWTVEEFVLNPRIDASRTRSTVGHIAGVEVIDEHTVEFGFKDAIFTNLGYTLGLYVLPKHFYSRFEPEEVNRSPGLLMGSGPFRLERLDPGNQWTPDTDLVLVRNEQYWGDQPPLASMRFRAISDELARLTALRRGEGDMIEPSSVQLRRVPQDDPQFRERFETLEWFNMRSGFSFIAWQCGERNGRLTPFHDARVRRAMTMLLDRERMVRDIWEGVGIVASGPSTSRSPGHNPSIRPWPYDIDAALALLAEAGWRLGSGGVLRDAEGRPFEFEFTIAAGGQVADRIAAFVRTQYQRAGIRVTVRGVDWSLYEEIQDQRDFDALIMGWSYNSPESDPRQTFHSASILDAGDNFVQWSNPEADRLIDLGRRTLDPEARQRVWHEFHALIHEEQPYTFLREVPWYRFISREIGNVRTHATGLMPWEFFRAAGPLPMVP